MEAVVGAAIFFVGVLTGGVVFQMGVATKDEKK